MARTKRQTLDKGHKAWMIFRLVTFINNDSQRKADFESARISSRSGVGEFVSRGKRFRLTITEITNA